MFTLLVNEMCMHGYTADNLLLNVWNAIPKDVRGNMSDSNHYRGISLCSSISKAIDNIIINRYGHLIITVYITEHYLKYCGMAQGQQCLTQKPELDRVEC